MKYLKIKPEFDGRQTRYKRYNHVEYYPLVTGALLTSAEIKRYNIPEKCGEYINIPQSQTYYFFGIRFAENLPEIAA